MSRNISGSVEPFKQRSKKIACGALTLQAAKSLLEFGRGASMGAALFPAIRQDRGSSFFVGRLSHPALGVVNEA